MHETMKIKNFSAVGILCSLIFITTCTCPVHYTTCIHLICTSLVPTIKSHLSVLSSSSLAYGHYNLTIATFQLIAHADLSCAFFLHLWAPFDFRSFSIQSNHLNFGLPSFLLQSGFPRNTSLIVLPDIHTR